MGQPHCYHYCGKGWWLKWIYSILRLTTEIWLEKAADMPLSMLPNPELLELFSSI